MKDPFKVEAYLMAAFLFGIPLVAILLVIVFGMLGQASPRVSRVLSGVSALVLLAFGGHLLASGVAALL